MTPNLKFRNTARVSHAMQPSNQPTSPPISDTSLSNKSANDDVALRLDLYSVNDRIKTFDHWPVPIPRKEDLAEAGFYYTNSEDTVKCPYCKIEVGHWVENDIPLYEHEKFSPNCRFLLHRRTTSLHSDERPRSPPRIPEGEDTYGICTSTSSPSKSMFQRLQIDDDVLPSSANSGEDTCGIHGIENARRSPVLAMQNMSKETIMQSLNVNPTELPVHKNYSSYSDRLKTYDKWPKESKLSPERLSLAGFIYMGENDRVTCFHCEGTLHSWGEFDDPWIEHAHWYPNCKYVLSMKGQKFIDNARLQKNEDLSRTEEEIRNVIETCKGFVSTADLNINENRKCKVNESSSKGISDVSCGLHHAESELNVKDLEARMTCLCCLANERDSILLPCYHMVACTKCANQLTKCCVCREPVLYRRRIFMP